MTTISQAVSGTIQLVAVGRDIYESVAKAMDAAESKAQSGVDKKAWVFAYAKSIIQEAGKNWDEWARHIANFIDAAKSIYNSLKGILK